MGDDWELFDRIKAKHEREAEAALAKAKAEAKDKEPFDLDRLFALYTPRSEVRYPRKRESAQREYERYYYLNVPEVKTLAEFADVLVRSEWE